MSDRIVIFKLKVYLELNCYISLSYIKCSRLMVFQVDVLHAVIELVHTLQWVGGEHFRQLSLSDLQLQI